MDFIKVSIITLLLILIDQTDSSYTPPRLEIKRLSNTPIISSWNNDSTFLYNYNSAFMPMWNDTDSATLLVRVQNLRSDAKSIYDAGPSKIAWSQTVDSSYLKYTPITKNNIIIDNNQEYQLFGVEDPRVVFFDNTYYL